MVNVPSSPSMVINAAKHMPLGFLVRDHPVCILITLFKAENPIKYHDIVPFPDPFNTQCLVMYKHY